MALPSTTGSTRLNDEATELLDEAANEIVQLRAELIVAPKAIQLARRAKTTSWTGKKTPAEDHLDAGEQKAYANEPADRGNELNRRAPK